MTTFIAPILCTILLLCKAGAQVIDDVTATPIDTNFKLSKSIVALKRLPELFSNEKLPQVGIEQNSSVDKCLHLLGCIQRLPDTPTTEQMIDPSKMKTLFKIFTRKSEVSVPYQPMLNCLSKSQSTCETYPFNLSRLVEANFDPKLRTVVYIGGYRSSSEFDEHQLDIKNSWLVWEEVNFVLVAWAGGNQGTYKSAVANTKVLARQITVLFYYLGHLKLGQNEVMTNERYTRRLNFVGHSLGAHTAGFVGAELGGRVGRITGLDPAGPMFIEKTDKHRLSRSNAALVDVLHTNGGKITLLTPSFFGLSHALGHLDFYANDGQHQPNCFTDTLGCSHKVAVEFYKSFLQHEVYMRKHLERLDHNYHNCHRMFAYASESYEHFQNGSSLVQKCPKSILDAADLHSSDINHCLVPLDFVSSHDELKENLLSQYKLDFTTSKSNKFFFTTHQSVPYLNNHQLIRARVSANSRRQKECDLHLVIKMAGGRKLERKVKRYRLIGGAEDGHMEILVPFLSPNLMSKYELAELDAHNFFPDQFDKLKDKLGKVFPSSIRLLGSPVGGAVEKTQNNKAEGLFGLFQSFFGSFESDDDENQQDNLGCSLNVESITVQPLKKIHRNLVAVYTLDGFEKNQLDLEFLFNENSILPKMTAAGEKNLKGKSSSELYLDTVHLGPFDPDMDTEPSFDPNLSNDELLGGEGLTLDEQEAQKETSTQVDGRIWIGLMIISLLMVTAFFFYSLWAMDQVERSQDDRQEWLVETGGETI